jgi:hypothetical protein
MGMLYYSGAEEEKNYTINRLIHNIKYKAYENGGRCLFWVLSEKDPMNSLIKEKDIKNFDILKQVGRRLYKDLNDPTKTYEFKDVFIDPREY